jgi:hypothetical protein
VIAEESVISSLVLVRFRRLLSWNCLCTAIGESTQRGCAGDRRYGVHSATFQCEVQASCVRFASGETAIHRVPIVLGINSFGGAP